MVYTVRTAPSVQTHVTLAHIFISEALCHLITTQTPLSTKPMFWAQRLPAAALIRLLAIIVMAFVILAIMMLASIRFVPK